MKTFYDLIPGNSIYTAEVQSSKVVLCRYKIVKIELLDDSLKFLVKPRNAGYTKYHEVIISQDHAKSKRYAQVHSGTTEKESVTFISYDCDGSQVTGCRDVDNAKKVSFGYVNPREIMDDYALFSEIKEALLAAEDLDGTFTRINLNIIIQGFKK